MNPLADLTQAPLLYRIGDKTYEVAPLTHKDLGAFCRFVQFADYYTLKDLPDIPADKLSTIFDQCLKKTVTLGDSAFNAVAESPAGLAEFAYLSLRHAAPSITRDEIAGWSIQHVSNICKLAVALSMPGTDSEESLKKSAELISQLRDKHFLA